MARRSPRRATAARRRWTWRSGSRSRASATEPPSRARVGEVVVDVADVARGRAKLFEFERDGEPLTGMVVADASGAVHVYVNRCPHVPYSLDLGDGNVLDPDGLTIVCSNHGARFDPDTGKCRWGPVRGRYLEPLPFLRDGDRLIVTIAPEAAGWPDDYEPVG